MEQVKEKREPNKKTFTELSLRRLKPPRAGQRVYWDSGIKGQLGLSVLASAGGTKTYRATYYLPNGHLNRKPVTVSLGRVGEIELTRARQLTAEYRGKADQGIDPCKLPEQQSNTQTYAEVVDLFIEQYAKPKQRTWPQTARILRKTCAPLLTRPHAPTAQSETCRGC
jgi:hypothetical protein